LDTIEARCFDIQLQRTIRAIHREQALEEETVNKEALSQHDNKDSEAQLEIMVCLFLVL